MTVQYENRTRAGTEPARPGSIPALDELAAVAARLAGAPMAVIAVGPPGRPEIITGPEPVPSHLVCAASIGLFSSGGDRIGRLAVLGEPGLVIDEVTRRHLESVAVVAADAVEVRREARAALARAEHLRRQAEELADALQASLLPPHPPSLPEMEIATRYVAGESGLMVGGDFFDVFRLGPNDWGILMGDVCGKGARPASLAPFARWAIRGAAARQFSPSGVLQDVNAAFAGEEQAADDRYCSAVFARLQLDTCGAWLTVANAGHPPPLLARRSGKVELRSVPTQPIGMFEAIQPVDDRVGLGPGDALVFYTDGITEARGGGGDLFGEERMIQAVRDVTGRPADEIADQVVGASRRFSDGRSPDDVAVVVVRVPDDAVVDPVGRLVAATGLPAADLDLPAYPRDTGPPTR